MLWLQNVKAITVRWIKDGSVRGYPGSQQHIPFQTLILYLAFSDTKLLLCHSVVPADRPTDR